MGAMADARYHRSLSPDSRPAHDGARLELRASDADRDRTAAVLANALATGRLTTTEHAERLVGDARFSKVAVHRGHYDPGDAWQHWRQQR